jgi:predicted RNA polymerase sigma factor
VCVGNVSCSYIRISEIILAMSKSAILKRHRVSKPQTDWNEYDFCRYSSLCAACGGHLSCPVDAHIAEGRAILARAVERRKAGPFQIKAAIADCQMGDTGPDWPQIAALYGALWTHELTPVVALNHGVALAEAGELKTALALIESLESQLPNYQPWHAASAALHAMSGDHKKAAAAYRQAIATAPGEAEALFLKKRLAKLAH